MKMARHIKKSLISGIDLLKCPTQLFQTVLRKRRGTFLLLVAFLAAGICSQICWPFPHFYLFSLLFLFIGSLAMWAISTFLVSMENVTATLANQLPAKRANLTYFSHGKSSELYIVCPLLIILVFGIGCYSMFGAFEFTPTTVWIVILFFVTVYISIIGYVQYIVLTLYIYNLATGEGQYKNLPKSTVGCIPAKLEWIQKLTKLSHIYRSAFFTLGSSYIIGYSMFCWLPKMQANTAITSFYFLWLCIFLLIVLLFPVSSLMQFYWIKKIVAMLKVSYIIDFTNETDLVKKSEPLSVTPSIYRLMQMICTTQILSSEDYPIKSVWSTGYAVILSVSNFAAAIMTIWQGISTESLSLLHIF